MARGGGRVALAALTFISTGVSTAAAPADPLLARLLAGANAVPPPALSFDRIAVASETSASGTERHTRVDRWDGRAWSVLSIDGKPLAPAAAAAALKSTSPDNVPGYYRLAAYLAANPQRVADPSGGVVYRLARLPPGSVAIKGAPPDKFAAELSVDAAGPIPYVRRARYFAPQPFRMMMVAKLDHFEATSDYRLNAAGRAELVRQVIDVSGAMFGREGSQHSEFTFVYR